MKTTLEVTARLK